MQQVSKGDVAAFGLLFDRHQARLIAFLTRFLGNRTLAEDIAQEAFLNIWRKRETFNSRQSFRVYLYVVAKNLALNEQTSVRNRRTVSLNALPEYGESLALTPAARENDPQGAALQKHLQCTISHALQKLPDEQRLCILLREYDGCSHQEVARIVGCSEVSARVLCFRARNRLKRLLAPLLESEERENHATS